MWLENWDAILHEITIERWAETTKTKPNGKWTIAVYSLEIVKADGEHVLDDNKLFSEKPVKISSLFLKSNTSSLTIKSLVLQSPKIWCSLKTYPFIGLFSKLYF